MIIIKRYTNRKLYNTETKKYITLDEIRNLILAGEEISIIDHEDGSDLTTMTLAQIIFEQEKKRTGNLPNTIFTRLIQAGEETLDNLRITFGNPVDFAKQVNRELEQRIQTLIKQNELSIDEGTHFLQKLLSLGHQSPSGTELEILRKYLVEEYDIVTRQDLEDLHYRLDVLTEEIEKIKNISK